MKNVTNLIEAVELEIAIKELDEVINKELLDVDIHLTFIDAKYAGDKLRDLEMVRDLEDRMTILYKLVMKLKDIEMKAIKIDNLEIYWKCEKRIAKLIEAMEYIRNEYMF